MDTWTPEAAHAVAEPEEVHVVTRRSDGTLRHPRTIWVVRDGDRVFVRSEKGRDADWFRWALATGSGQLISRGAAHDVHFTEAAEPDLARVDGAYRAKYGRYAPVVDRLQSPDPRAATLEVSPA